MDTLRPTSRSPRIRVLAGGHLLIGSTIVLGILAAHTGHNVLAALVALLLAFQAVSGFRSFRVLRGTRLGVRLPRAVDDGGVAYAEVELSRPGRRGVASSLELEAIVEGDHVDVPGASTWSASRPGRPRRCACPSSVARAAWRGSPGGACRARTRATSSAARTASRPTSEVLVRPAVRDAAPPVEDRAPDADLAGARRARARQRRDARAPAVPRRGPDPRDLVARDRAHRPHRGPRAGRDVARSMGRRARHRRHRARARGRRLDDRRDPPPRRRANDVPWTCVSRASTRPWTSRRAAASTSPSTCSRGSRRRPTPRPAGRRRDAPRVPRRRARPCRGRHADPSTRRSRGWRPRSPSRRPLRRRPRARRGGGSSPCARRSALRPRGRCSWAPSRSAPRSAVPLAVAPQFLAAGAVPLVRRTRRAPGASAPPAASRSSRPPSPSRSCPAATGGALVLVRFLAAFVASLQLRRRTSGEDGFVLAVLLAETALAAALTSSVLAALVALALAGLAHRAVGAWHELARPAHARRGAVRVQPEGGRGVDGADVAVARASRRAADGASLAVLVLAVPLFATLPRTDTPFLSLPQLVAARASPAIGEQHAPRHAGPHRRRRRARGDRAAPQRRRARRRALSPRRRLGPVRRHRVAHVASERPTSSYDRATGLRWRCPGWCGAPDRRARGCSPSSRRRGPRLPLPERTARVAFADPLPRDRAPRAWRRVDARARRRGPALAPRGHGRHARGTRGPDATDLGATSRRRPDVAARRLAPEVARVVAGLDGDRARAAALEAWVSKRARGTPSTSGSTRPTRSATSSSAPAPGTASCSPRPSPSRSGSPTSRRVSSAGTTGAAGTTTGEFWVVRRRDAHAWVEACIDGEGWFRLDATPAAGRPTRAVRRRARCAGPRAGRARCSPGTGEVLGFDADRQRSAVTTLRRLFVDVFEASPAAARPRAGRRRRGRRRRRGPGASPLARRARQRGTADRPDAAREASGPRVGARSGSTRRPSPPSRTEGGRAPRPRPPGGTRRACGRRSPASGAAVEAITRAHERVRFGAGDFPPESTVTGWLASVRGVPRRRAPAAPVRARC